MSFGLREGGRSHQGGADVGNSVYVEMVRAVEGESRGRCGRVEKLTGPGDG